MSKKINYSNFNNFEIVIIGLGYVGLTLSIFFASKKFKVLGVEKNRNVLQNLSKRKSHFYEPNLENLLKKTIDQGYFEFSNKIPVKKNKSRIYVIAVGTPIDKKGNVRNEMIKSVAKQLSNVLENDDLVMLRSTVTVGTSKNIIKPILDKANKKYYFAFCPERTMEGKAIDELSSLPQIVGGIDQESQQIASEFFLNFNEIIIKVSNLETAEMMKLVDNTYRDLNFAYANEIARLCNEINVDCHEVIKMGKIGYKRTNVSLPGPVGGPCLEKDTFILSESFKKYRVKPSLSLLARKNNQKMFDDVFKYLKTLITLKKTKLKIVVLGIAFKGSPSTNDIRGTTAIHIKKSISKNFENFIIYGYDDYVDKKDILLLGFKYLNKLDDCFKNSDIVIMHNNNTNFRNLNLEQLSNKMRKNSIIYNFWGNENYKNLVLKNNVKYISFGSHKVK